MNLSIKKIIKNLKIKNKKIKEKEKKFDDLLGQMGAGAKKVHTS